MPVQSPFRIEGLPTHMSHVALGLAAPKVLPCNQDVSCLVTKFRAGLDSLGFFLHRIQTCLNLIQYYAAGDGDTPALKPSL